MMNFEQAQSVRQSPVWAYICSEIDFKIDALKNQLTLCAPEQLAILQTRIRALQEIKSLPDDVASREEGGQLPG